MSDDDKPLSTLVSQGWEVVNFAVAYEAEGAMHCFLLRRQKSHKVLRIRPKMMGKGYIVKEMDV